MLTKASLDELEELISRQPSVYVHYQIGDGLH